MQILAGLGNPGKKHAWNRHNVGFMAVDRIAERHGFQTWTKRFSGYISKGCLDGSRVILLKPSTFMNRSGQSIGEVARYFKIEPSNIVVFHDEIDLSPGKCRVKTGGGTSGHNGIKSVHRHIGSGYRRVRIGIGHPGIQELVTPHVLGNFSRSERQWLAKFLDCLADGAHLLVKRDNAGFMNLCARAQRTGSNKARRPGRENLPTETRNPGADLVATDGRWNSQGRETGRLDFQSRIARLISRFGR